MKLFSEYKIFLSRERLFYIGVIIIGIYIILNRYEAMKDTTVCRGVVVSYRIPEEGLHGNPMPEVEFMNLKGEKNVFLAGENYTVAIGDTVPVIYKMKDPSKAWIYNFSFFWYETILWGLFPLIVLTASVYSYFKKNDLIIIDLKKFSVLKKNTIVDRKDDSSKLLK